jgi:NAD(P)-dependent dehydrogenase (short-subunit alcohol dehydrogenase family)
VSKVVLITGANNGIGLHMTAALLERGYRLAAIDLSGENLAPLRTRYTGQLLFCPCDLTDEVQVKAAVAQTLAAWQRIDILVNNACLAVFRRFEERPLADLQGEFEVNYYGTLRMIRAVLPQMKAQGGGIIHNVSSGVGISGFAGLIGYTSTKGALESATRTLAIELEPQGITVNLMHPPLTSTRSASPLGLPPQVMADPAVVGRKLAAKIESRRAVIAADARTALYLLAVYRFPLLLGRFFSRMTEKARAE